MLGTNVQAETKYGKECLGHYKFDIPLESDPALLPVKLLEVISINSKKGELPGGDKVSLIMIVEINIFLSGLF